MKIRAGDLRDDILSTELGDSRLFFDSPDFDYESTIKYLETLPGLAVHSHNIEAPPGLGPIWQVRFTYDGFDFLVETNHHGTASSFFVNDPKCPDETLLTLLAQFARLGPITWNHI